MSLAVTLRWTPVPLFQHLIPTVLPGRPPYRSPILPLRARPVSDPGQTPQCPTLPLYSDQATPLLPRHPLPFLAATMVSVFPSFCNRVVLMARLLSENADAISPDRSPPPPSRHPTPRPRGSRSASDLHPPRLDIAPGFDPYPLGLALGSEQPTDWAGMYCTYLTRTRNAHRLQAYTADRIADDAQRRLDDLRGNEEEYNEEIQAAIRRRYQMFD